MCSFCEHNKDTFCKGDLTVIFDLENLCLRSSHFIMVVTSFGPQTMFQFVCGYDTVSLKRGSINGFTLLSYIDVSLTMFLHVPVT